MSENDSSSVAEDLYAPFSYEPLFLGTVEVTRDHVTCTPPISDPEDQRLVLMDYLGEVAWEAPWDDPDADAKLLPLPLLMASSAYHFEAFREELYDRKDVRGLARVEAALLDGPYTGALHAVCIKFVSGTSFRSCEVNTLAIRNGNTWRRFDAVPLDEGELAALVASALQDMDTRTPDWEVWCRPICSLPCMTETYPTAHRFDS